MNLSSVLFQLHLGWKDLVTLWAIKPLVPLVSWQVLGSLNWVFARDVDLQGILISIFFSTEGTAHSMFHTSVLFFIVTDQTCLGTEASITNVTRELLYVHMDILNMFLQGIFARESLVADTALSQVGMSF